MKNRPWDYWVLWVVVLLLVGFNGALGLALVQARAQAAEGLAQAAKAVGQLRQSTISYTVTIDQRLPVSITVPFRTIITVPVSATLPINTEVTIPLNTPFGQFPVTLPIRASIPVNLETQVPIVLSVPISASVPVKLTVPIDLSLAQTDLGAGLLTMQMALEAGANDLRRNLWEPK